MYMHLLGNGMYNKSYHNEHMSFCHKMCNVVNTLFFMTISHFNENNDLGSSKALKWVRIKSSFFSKGLFFTIIKLFVLKSSKQDFVFGRTAYPLFGIPCISDEKLLMEPLLSNIKGLIFSDQYMLVRKIPFIIWFFLTMSVLRFCQLDPTLSMHPTSCGLSSWTLRLVAGGRRSTTLLRG